MNKWKNIWDSKTLDIIDMHQDEFEIFCKLKKADGFDVSVKDEQGYFKWFYEDGIKIFQTAEKLINDTINSLYEVGCGSGANLYLFSNRVKKDVFCGGIDYSDSLVNIAKKVVKSNDLMCGEAIDIDETVKYDMVMSDSVFQYFVSVDYAEAVLRKMIYKANKIIYLGELHDVTMQEEWLYNRRKSMENYDAVYEGLSKTFYDKKWIEKIAAEFGKRVFFTKCENPEYWNGRFIFNCFIY